MAFKNLTLNELIQKIEGGALEHNFIGVDFKSDWRQDYGKDISAIANHLDLTRGWIIAGLNDEGQGVSTDLSWSKKAEELISNHVRQFLTPAWAVNEISAIKIRGSECIAIEVRNPGDVVYWNNTAYHLSCLVLISRK